MTILSRASLEPQEITEFLKREIQLKDVSEKILYQKVINRAAAERNLTVTAEEIQEEADKFRHENRLEKASETLAWLADNMITSDDWEAGIRQQLLAKKLSKCLFDKDVEKFFGQNRLDFDQILLYQIIVANEKLAQELFYQIEEKEISFYQAAHIYDIDEERRQKCGFEGKLYRWNLRTDIAAIVFGVPIGQVVNPVKTPQGYHILMVERFIPAELTPERYDEILDRLFQDWLNRELNYMLHSDTMVDNVESQTAEALGQ
ncbi:peptidylprolyl isomerase [Moorena producens]|uniref:peptidylprolyl isomerase n=1 Tax=Moorena producens TaxID=1155739 RepID=UPI003C726BB0